MEYEKPKIKKSSIIAISLVLMLLSIGMIAESQTTNNVTGDFWKLLTYDDYDDTLVLNDSSWHVNIGENLSTNYKLNVNGDVRFNDSVLTLKGDDIHEFLSLNSYADTQNIIFKIQYFINRARLTIYPNILGLELLIDGDLTINDDSIFYGSSIFEDIVNFNDDVYFDGIIYSNLGSEITIADDVKTDKNLTVVGNLSVYNLNVSGDINCLGNVYMNGKKLSPFYKGFTQAYTYPTLPSNEWVTCNATNHHNYGYVPDLEGMFIIGQNDSYKYNNTYGNRNTTLTVANLPPHNHNMSGYTYIFSGGTLGIVLRNSYTSQTLYTYQTGVKGNIANGNMLDTKFSNVPQCYALYYICYVGN